MSPSALLGPVCLVVLFGSDPAANPQKTFDLLLADYRAYGLPLPPNNARPVRFESNWSSVGPDGKGRRLYNLGFLLRPATDQDPPVLLVGTEEYRPDRKDIEIIPIEPRAAEARNVSTSWMDSHFWMNTGLPTAIQLKARGWDELAHALLGPALEQAAGHHFSQFFQPGGQPARAALAHVAWAHSGNELTRPNTDRKAIAKGMKAALAEEKSLDTEANQELLRSLELALVPSKAKPGSVEALIDGLVELSGSSGVGGRGTCEPQYLKLVQAGFEAVPSLIEHLDDDRLTRAVRQGFNNFPTWNIRVKHVVSELLERLAPEELDKGWLRRQQGWTVEKADAQAWWEKARKIGEEAHVLERVLPPKGGQGFPNQHMLLLIAHRYPQHLPKLYRTLLDECPDAQSWTVVELLHSSSLPREQKIDLYVHASRNKGLEHRRAAFWKLKELDRKLFTTLLVETLEGLPKTPEGEYWRYREPSFAYLVPHTNDAHAWVTLTKVARRSDVGLRMEMLGCAAVDASRSDRKALDFFAAFLDDATVRDEASDPKKFDGFNAGGEFSRLEVRNFAAMQLAWLLDMKIEPDKDWNDEKWADLRAKVRKAVKH